MLVVSNNINNTYSTVVNVVPLTAKCKKPYFPSHVPLKGFGLIRPSFALCEQIATLDKYRLGKKLGVVDDADILKAVQRAMMCQFNMEMCN